MPATSCPGDSSTSYLEGIQKVSFLPCVYSFGCHRPCATWRPEASKSLPPVSTEAPCNPRVVYLHPLWPCVSIYWSISLSSRRALSQITNAAQWVFPFNNLFHEFLHRGATHHFLILLRHHASSAHIAASGTIMMQIEHKRELTKSIL